MRWIALTLLCFFLSGCGLIGIETNIRFNWSNGAVLEVVNESDYLISLSVNGEEMEFIWPKEKPTKTFKRGQSVTVRRTTSRSKGREDTIVAKAWDCNGRFVGSDVRPLFVPSNHFESGAWKLYNQNFSHRDWGFQNHGHNHNH